MAEPPVSDGYYVKPTQDDETNAYRYASEKVAHAICTALPNEYTWEPALATGYPCPDPLTCTPGVCKFKQAACEARSTLPYFDCERDGNNVCAYSFERSAMSSSLKEVKEENLGNNIFS